MCIAAVLNMKLNKNPISFNDLIIRKYKLRDISVSSPKSVNGLDTETLNGYCKLIASSDKKYYLTKDINACLEFLTRRVFRNAHNFFFNIRYDFQAIVKYLPKTVLYELYREGKVKYNNYLIKYIPKKMFSIRKHKHVYKFYDISQFYNSSLEKAAQKYLNKEKYIEKIDRKLLGTSAQYWKENIKKIITYCVNDAVLTKELGEYLQNEFINKLNFVPRQYISKAGVSKEYFRLTCNIPDVSKIPKAVLAIALNAYSGGRFEIGYKGYFKKLYSIDICSAYPYQIAHLPDVTTGEWRKVTDVHDNALIGFYMAKVFIPYMYYSPLPFRLKQNYIIYPCGEFATYITKTEYDKYKDIIEIDIIRGYEYYDDNPIYPFKEAIYNIYKEKQNTPKTDFRYSLLKILMNSLYGSFYEKIKDGDKYKTGKLFNPVYATYITANTRCVLYDIIKQYKKKVVMSATDGLLLTEKPDINFSKELGAWDFEAEGEAVVLKSGVYEIGDKQRSRGLSRVHRIKTPFGDFDNLFNYIRAKPELTKYPVYIERPLNIGECLLHHKKLDISMINEFTKLEYVVDINKDLKRLWSDNFEKGIELFDKTIDSKPILIQ